MELYKLVQIYQITNSCYQRARYMLADSEWLESEVIENLCSFLLSLRDTMDYIEEIINEKGPYVEKITDLFVLNEVYALININTVYEELISTKISMNVH